MGISVSIGQGPILVTPVQMATMTAMVANGGLRVTPHLRKDAPVPAPQRFSRTWMVCSTQYR